MKKDGYAVIRSLKTGKGTKSMIDCYNCPAFDRDAGVCVIPASEHVYACPNSKDPQREEFLNRLINAMASKMFIVKEDKKHEQRKENGVQ